MDHCTGQAVLHDQGGQRNPRLLGVSIWIMVFLVAILSFSSAFFYKRYDAVRREADRLSRTNRELELTKKTSAGANELTPEERAKVEREIRARYEARDAAITAKLNELYETEARIREKFELPARAKALPAVDGPTGGGQGGASVSVFDANLFLPSDRKAQPSSLIYGLSRPSADLIVQEIGLRTESFESLFSQMGKKEEETRVLSRTPSIWPSVHPQARLSSRFGYRRDPFTNAVRHHDGTDICAPVGSAVVATAAGTVSFAGWDDDFGNCVRIDHGNNIETLYAHLQQCTVTAGQQVKRGDKIGKLGSTGRSTGPHIHYEVWVNGRPVDSGSYLGK